MIPEPSESEPRQSSDFDPLYVTERRALWRAVLLVVWLLATLGLQGWLGYIAVQHGILSMIAVMFCISLVTMAGIQQINRL